MPNVSILALSMLLMAASLPARAESRPQKNPATQKRALKKIRQDRPTDLRDSLASQTKDDDDFFARLAKADKKGRKALLDQLPGMKHAQ